MKKFLVLSLAVILAAGVGLAQECPGKAAKDCDSAKECGSKVAGLAAKIDQLEQKAAKGCETSQAKLDALVKTAGAKDVAALKETVAACEKYAGMGCGQSKDLLAKLDGELDGSTKAGRVPLSAHVAQLVSSDGSCEELCAELGIVCEDCAVCDGKALVAKIEKIEACAAKGCKMSAKTLARLDARVRPAPLSDRVAKLAECSECGCEVSKAALAGLTEGRESAAVVADIRALEASAAKGDAKSAASLKAIEAKLPAAKPVSLDACDGSDCTDCADCSDCTEPGQKKCGACPVGQ
jgi:hypothetical protein